MKDLQTRKKRMTKKKIEADFRLADNDDFFGFKKEDTGLTLFQVSMIVFVGLPVLYGLMWVLLSLTPNI